MRRRAAVVGLLGLAITTSGCGISGGVYNLPLPGGADVGKHPYSLSANFTDVLDLVPQSSVKVDNVAVGRVSSISLNPDGRSARVRMTLNDSVRLPNGTTARLQQTSLLGEKYVALVRPGDPSEAAAPGSSGTTTTPSTSPAVSTGSGYLRNGDVLPLSRTSQAVGIEQVLGALSLLLNGGGIGQFQEISRELQQVSAGRPDQVRAFLDKTAVFVRDLDRRRDSITAAIDGLNRLGTSLNAQQPQLKAALDGLSPGLKVLADQRPQLVRMLNALNTLSDVSVDTLDQAQTDIVRSLKDLDPVLTQLAKSGNALPQALQILLTYPFPDSVLGAIKGDYLNVFLTMNLGTPGGPWSQPDSNWPEGTPVPGFVQTVVTPAALAALPSQSASQSASPTASPTATDSSSPMLLPSTSSAAPGVPTSSLPTSPSTSSEPAPTDSSSPTPSETGSATPTDPTTSTAPTDPTTSAPPSDTPSASDPAGTGTGAP